MVAEEGPAYGAALLAGVAAGVWRDLPDACQRVRLRDDITVPDPHAFAAYQHYGTVQRSLYLALHGAMRTLTVLANVE